MKTSIVREFPVTHNPMRPLSDFVVREIKTTQREFIALQGAIECAGSIKEVNAAIDSLISKVQS